ncbi:MAG: response regulator [Bacteroidota bacterium]
MENKIEILLVDDNPADLFYIKEVIQDDTNIDAVFHEAKTLHEAREKIDQESVDVVLLDLFLPDADGIDTFHKIMKDDAHYGIIVLSGLNDEETALQTVQAGAQDFLTKGEFDGKLLEKTIIYSIERKRNERLIKQSNEKYKQLFDLSPLPLFIIQSDNKQIIQSNKQAQKTFGYDEATFSTLNLNQLIVHDSNNYEARNQYTRANKSDGTQIFVSIYTEDLELNGTKCQLIQLEDITDRVNFERNRLEIINSIQDNERRNFAMELHDGLAQELVLMNIYMQQIKEKCEAVPEIDQIQSILSDAMIHTRRLTYNIAPPLLEEGFFKGLSVLFERFDNVNEMHIYMENRAPETLNTDEIDEDSGYNAFRIIQEFLNNSIKHSSAKNIKGSVERHATKYVIIIEDDGVGYDQEKVSQHGMGTSNMFKRSEIFDFKVDITSENGKGTSLRLEIPIQSGF